MNPVCSQDWYPLPPEVVHSLLGGLGGMGAKMDGVWDGCDSPTGRLWHPFLIRFLYSRLKDQLLLRRGSWPNLLHHSDLRVCSGMTWWAFLLLRDFWEFKLPCCAIQTLTLLAAPLVSFLGARRVGHALL